MLTRLATLIVAAVTVLLGTASVATATAQDTASLNNPVWSGLWSGANLTVPGTQTSRSSSGQYVALGDSVAAGVGLPASADTNAQCGRSTAAYAYRVAQVRNLPVLHVACSGAKAGDLFTYQSVDGPNVKPQLDTAFAAGTPALITITAGANDIHWNDFLHKCYAYTCGTATDNYIAQAYQSFLKVKLYYLLYDINARSGGTPPPVVLTGYYNALSPACSAVEPRLSTAEIAWLSSQLATLNQTIERVASQFSFARFAPVDFTGHDMCSAQPWVQGPNDATPFHPTVTGQQVIAQSVLNTLVQ